MTILCSTLNLSALGCYLIGFLEAKVQQGEPSQFYIEEEERA